MGRWRIAVNESKCQIDFLSDINAILMTEPTSQMAFGFIEWPCYTPSRTAETRMPAIVLVALKIGISAPSLTN